MTLYDGNGPVEEPLAARVLRQVRSGVLDEDRLLPPDDKRRREIEKKLDRLSERSGLVYVRGGASARGSDGQGDGAPERRSHGGTGDHALAFGG